MNSKGLGVLPAWSRGQPPRRVHNLLPQASSGNPSTGCRLWGTSSGWAYTQTNGTVTAADGVLTCVTTATAARAFASRDVNFTSGRYYCVTVELVDFDVTAPNAIITNISTTTAATWGTRDFAFTAANMKRGARFGVIVKAGATAAHSIRIGIGVAAGQTISSGAISLSFRNPIVHEIANPESALPRAVNDGSTASSVFAPSPHFGPAEYCPAGDVVGFDYEAAHILSRGTSGEVVEAERQAIDVHGYASGAVVGHSFATDESDWPHQLRILMPESAIRYRGHSGGDVNVPTEVPAMLTEILQPQETHPRALPATWVVLNAGCNAIFTGTLTNDPLPDLVRGYIETVQQIKRAGAWPILINVTPASGWTDYDETEGHEAYIQQFNSWLRRYASDNDCGFVDAHALLRDPASPAALLSTYTSDSLHPNAVAGYRVASRVAALVRRRYA